jgi:hypothetical protein
MQQMMAVPEHRRLFFDFQQRRPEIYPRSDYVAFVVNKVTLRKVFIRVLRVPLPILIPPTRPYSLLIPSATLCDLDVNSVSRQQTNRILLASLKASIISVSNCQL